LLERLEFTKMLRALGVNSEDDIESILAAIQQLATAEGPESAKPNTALEVNPFAVLWSILTGVLRDPTGVESQGMDRQCAGLTPDSQPEAVLRSHAILFCRESCQQLWRALKAVCRMAAL
jgi:hypothetical protein